MIRNNEISLTTLNYQGINEEENKYEEVAVEVIDIEMPSGAKRRQHDLRGLPSKYRIRSIISSFSSVGPSLPRLPLKESKQVEEVKKDVDI